MGQQKSEKCNQMETWYAGRPRGKKQKQNSEHMQDKGSEVEKYLKEADVPLVGYFANDTENRFTAGIDNNSEEIKKNSMSHSNL